MVLNTQVEVDDLLLRFAATPEDGRLGWRGFNIAGGHSARMRTCAPLSDKPLCPNVCAIQPAIQQEEAGKESGKKAAREAWVIHHQNEKAEPTKIGLEL